MTDIERINKLLGTNFKTKEEIDWNDISYSYKLSENFIEEFKDEFDWEYISCYQNLSENFIEKHKDKVDWYYISIHQDLSEKFIEKYKDKVNWPKISENQVLSEEFIKKYKDKVDWYYISNNQNLSESFMEEFKDSVNWNEISRNQILSEEFIEKYKDKVNWYCITDTQLLSWNFLLKYKNDIPINSLKNALFNQPLLNIDKLEDIVLKEILFLIFPDDITLEECDKYNKIINDYKSGKINKFHKLYLDTKNRGWFIGYVLNRNNKYILIANECINKDLIFDQRSNNIYKVRIYWKNLKNLKIVNKFDLIRKVKGL